MKMITPNMVRDCFFVYPDRGQGQLFVQPITVRDSVEETCLETRSQSSILTFILHHGMKLTASGINLEIYYVSKVANLTYAQN